VFHSVSSERRIKRRFIGATVMHAFQLFYYMASKVYYSYPRDTRIHGRLGRLFIKYIDSSLLLHASFYM